MPVYTFYGIIGYEAQKGTSIHKIFTEGLNNGYISLADVTSNKENDLPRM